MYFFIAIAGGAGIVWYCTTGKGWLDALEYGLCCHESWGAKPATYETLPASVDEDGNAVTPERTVLLDPATEVGDIWTLRYDEVYAFEAAYQRRRADRIEARIAALEAQ